MYNNFFKIKNWKDKYLNSKISIKIIGSTPKTVLDTK